MSLFQMPTLRKIFGTFDGLRSARPRKDKKAPTAGLREPRRLALDPLEERVLLTVSATTPQATLVTQALSSIDDSATTEGSSQPLVAMDDAGNFVIVWSQNDGPYYYDENGEIVDFNDVGHTLIIDPDSQTAMTDYNVYARYFTDTVQKITLPQSVLDSPSGKLAFMDLAYGGSEVQTLKLDTVTENYRAGFWGTIVCQLEFSFDVNGDGSIGSGETATMTYDESAGAAANADTIKETLTAIGGALANVTVSTNSTNEYTIAFGDDQNGVDQPLIGATVLSSTSGFLPSAQTATARQPRVIRNIPISATDPELTVTAIKSFFMSVRAKELTTTFTNETPVTTVGEMLVGAPEVTASPGVNEDGEEDGTVFDITFTGASGKSEQPELRITSLTVYVDGVKTTYTGTALTDVLGADPVVVTKGPSEAFRVNPVEEDNPFTYAPDFENQYNPSVAMDADGTNFVIAWESSVSDATDVTNRSDIYACQFSPSGYQTSDDESDILGVLRQRAQREEVWTFRFNNSTAVEGTFKLRVGDPGPGAKITTEMTFDSTDLNTVASQMETQLGVYYPGISVTVTKATNAYQFRVIFPNNVATADRAAIQIVDEGTDLTDGTLVHDLSRYRSFTTAQTNSDDGYTFRVNTTTGNPQIQPSVGMDADGNFMIAWATRGQDLSFFNGIFAQRYDKYGEKLAAPAAATVVNRSEWRVDNETTVWTVEPNVAMSDDGHVVVVWTTTNDPDYLNWANHALPDDSVASVLASVFAPDGDDLTVLRSPFGVGGGGRGSAAFDSRNDYIIAWSVVDDNDQNTGHTAGVRAIMWSIDNPLDSIRDEFRANGLHDPSREGVNDFPNPDSTTHWPGHQSYGQAALDADGDLVVTYSGFGPDVSQNVELDQPALDRLESSFLAYDAKYNTNLWNYVNWDNFNNTYSSSAAWYWTTGNSRSSGDVDGVIEAVLIYAQGQGATDEELGQISGLLENMLGYLRGDASGVMYSLFDTAVGPGNATPQILASDTVVNTLRDGTNTRYFLTIDQSSTSGNFILRLVNPLAVNAPQNYSDITIAPVYVNNVFQVEQTRVAIEAAIRAAAVVGGAHSSWNYNGAYLLEGGEGPVQVETVAYNAYQEEINERSGTYWDLNALFSNGTTGEAVYEITFQGELHDTPIGLSLHNYNNTLKIGSANAMTPQVRLFEEGDSGTDQYLSSVAMTPEGSFVVAWKQNDRTSNGGYNANSTSSYYFRYYQESSDTAGPKVTNIMGPDGSSLADGGVLNNNSGDQPTVLVVNFSEELSTITEDSVENVSNWVLLKDGVPVTDGIQSISFGINRAYDLKNVYSLDVTQSNTWQAVVVLSDALESGTYTLQALAKVPGTNSGLVDKAGNTLEYTGFNLSGTTFSQEFVVKTTAATDAPVQTSPANPAPAQEQAVALIRAENALDGRTDAETASAIAAASDGRYVVVWTATVDMDPSASTMMRDRLFYRLYDASGAPAQVPELDASGNYLYWADAMHLTKVPSATPIDGLELVTVPSPVLEVDASGTGDQRYGSVAMDADGDFVVTWTDYAQGAGSGTSAIKVRQFNALGNIKGAQELTDGSNPVLREDGTRVYVGVANPAASILYGTVGAQVNSITYGNPKWSTVAMGPSGDFVICWTTFGQEDSQLGASYGVFARQYDASGEAANAEFQVNATSAGNQHSASVDMDANGDFIVAWVSDQNGNDDIYYRFFRANGTPTGDMPAYGVANLGNWESNQSYPDVALNLTGTTAVITWTSSAAPTGGISGATDTSGDGVYAVQFTPGTAVPPNAFLVNTTTTSNQSYSSVAMDHSGAFVITWSGRGTQTGQLDSSGYGGIYYQRYTSTAVPTGGETRANVLTVGDQWLSSIDATAKGNFVLAWTGRNTTDPAQNSAVYTYASTLSNLSTVGPWVSGVTVDSATELDREQGSTIDPTNYLVVLFDEFVSTTNGTKGLDSVMNINNWSLLKNGAKVTGAIQSVTFAWNKFTRKYEAKVTFNSTLGAGSYVLIASDVITDGVNRLDGDFNGTPGTAGGTGTTGYQFNFIVTATGQDTAVTVTDPGTVNAHTGAESAQAVAADDDGDYVVTWTASDTVTGNDRVYFRLYDIDGTPAELPVVDQDGVYTGAYVECPILAVDSSFLGSQRDASVAMDADGDFVVTWTSYADGAPADGNIMARRFNGNLSGLVFDAGSGQYVAYSDVDEEAVFNGLAPFMVNSVTTGNQKWSSVAMDAAGQFVITWSSQGRDNSDGGWGVYARRYNAKGEALVSDTDNNLVIDGSDTNYEFLVNVATAGHQYDSSVSMSATGAFVIAWTYDVGQPGPDGVHARYYRADGTSEGTVLNDVVFDVNVTPAGNQQYPSVALSADGATFVVAWSSAAQDGSGEGVYSRRFRYTAGALTPVAALSGEILVNTTTLGDQTYPSVAMDHSGSPTDPSGSYVITWTGAGSQVGQEDTYGVYYQRFDRSGVAQGSETLVNNITAGKQWLSSVDTDARGNLVMAWTGGDPSAVFTFSSYNSVPLADRAGPWVTGVTESDGRLVLPGDTLARDTLTSLVVLFDEQLKESLVEDVSNWVLIYNGTTIVGGVHSADFSYNQPAGKWQALVTFDANGLATGTPALGVGNYVLVVRTAVEDIAGNLLDGDFNGTAGTSTGSNGYTGYAFSFGVVARPFDQSVETLPGASVGAGETVINGQTTEGSQAVASDSDGDYVVVWTAYDSDAQADRVYFRLFDANGTPAQVPLLDANGNYTGTTVACPKLEVDSSSGVQRYASVAMDSDGDFVITWTSYADGQGDVLAKRFNALGNLKGVQEAGPGVYVPFADVSASTSAFVASSTAAGSQKWSNVAMDADGDFVITWTSWGKEAAELGETYGVYARRFDAQGTPLASDTNNDGFVDFHDTDVEFRVNQATAGNQLQSNVAMAALGQFVITWTSNVGTPGADDDVMVRTYNADGTASSNELRVNATTIGNQRFADVALDATATNVVVVWTGPGAAGNEVYSRRFPFAITTTPTTPEVTVNTSTLGDQNYPSVAMNRLGAYIVAWSGSGTQTGQQDQGEDLGGVFYQQFDQNGNRLNSETRVNNSVLGEQTVPSIASDADGNFVVVFTGPTGLDALEANQTSVYMSNSIKAFVATDASGAWVSHVQLVDADNPTGGARVLPGDTLALSSAGLDQLKVVFDDELDEIAVESVSSWTVTRNGVVVSGAIQSISYEYNVYTGKYEAIVTFKSGVMTAGSYVLTVRDLVIDSSMNRLDGDFDGTAGDYDFPFSIAQAAGDNSVLPSASVVNVPAVEAEYALIDEAGAEGRAVAVDGDGDYVVVWTALNPATNHYQVYFRLYGRDGKPAQLPLLNAAGEYQYDAFEHLVTADAPILAVDGSASASNYHQREPSVAMDADGDFIITWTNYTDLSPSDGVISLDDGDIVARRFNSLGNLLGVREVTDGNGDVVLRDDGTSVVEGVPNESPEMLAYGSVISVNNHTLGMQKWSNVALNVNGDFVVTWTSVGQEAGQFGTSQGVYARRFDADGTDPEVEFLVNQTTAGNQYRSRVAMSAQGVFVVTWTTDASGDEDVMARVYNANGVAPVGELLVNARTPGVQDVSDHASDVAMSVDGTSFVVTWVSAGQDASGDDVYSRRFSFNGITVTPSTNEIRVNTTTLGDQSSPAVAMDHTGGYVIAWSGFGTQTGEVDTTGTGGVFYQRYSAAGAAVGRELRANNYTLGSQYAPSVGCDADGNLVLAWTGVSLVDSSQTAVFTYAGASNAQLSNSVGPWVTGVETPSGGTMSLILGETTALFDASLSTLKVYFDSELSTTSGFTHSVLNRSNWVLSSNGSPVANAIQDNITFEYDEVTRKWVATITFDANGTTAGTPALGQGNYILSLRDAVWDGVNTLDGNYDGRADTSANVGGYYGFAVKFTIPASISDVPVPPTDYSNYDNANTYSKSANSVAANAEGDYVVVWTAWDAVLGRDRVYYRLYDANGTPAQLPLLDVAGNYQYEAGKLKTVAAPVMKVSGLEFEADPSNPVDQRNASVAMDADGDFVVTWTSYTGDGQDVYARRFTATANLKGLQGSEATGYTGVADSSLEFDARLSRPFRVNTYTAGNQQWSSVAMDMDGDFVITWSSYGQENGGQLGLGYGIYAQMYDMYADPQGAEFQVNVTTANSQRFSSVSMDAVGGFVVVWSSGASGSDDIIARTFWADGSPQDGTGQGEILINQATAGHQRYPDVALSADGGTYVVTWTSTGSGSTGDDVYSRSFSRLVDEVENPRVVVSDATIPVQGLWIQDRPIWYDDEANMWFYGDPAVTTATITVTDSFDVADLNVQLSLTHPHSEDLIIQLVAPDGAAVTLANREADGEDFDGTIFDDAAATSIVAASAPFSGTYRPVGALAALNGRSVTGIWTLRITDMTAQIGDDESYLHGWSLDFLPARSLGAEQRVNSTVAYDQGYSSVAMDRNGSYVIAWSGRGTQSGESDTAGSGGVFYQRYTASRSPVGGETRANNNVLGNQSAASVASDAEGNFMVVWTGMDPDSPDPDNPLSTVFHYASISETAIPDGVGPWVTGVTVPNGSSIHGETVTDGSAIVSSDLKTMTVLFDEEMYTVGGKTGANSIVNKSNWRLDRNGIELVGAITNVDFSWNPAVRKWQAVVTFDGNGQTSNPVGGPPALGAGSYILSIRDSVWDARRNALDGDYDGVAGTASSGSGGYEFHFVVIPASGEVAYGPEKLVDGIDISGNDTTDYPQETSATSGTGQATEQSTKAVAMDHDGDYVVVWTSYGQDGGSADPNAATNGGIYMRLYDSTGTALTTEILVNTTTVGNQRNASVAMDADGDFVVAWESYNTSTKNWDVYARRFDSAGTALISDTNADGDLDGSDTAGEFLVNAATANDQLNPAVAMDDYGNFVIVWATVGQSYSYFNEVRGQLYTSDGIRLFDEFLVNRQTAAGTAPAGQTTVNPAVAMNGGGDFVVVWDQITQQVNGLAYNSVIYGRLYNSDGSPNTSRPAAFQVSNSAVGYVSDTTHQQSRAATGGSTTRRQARNAQVVMDDAGYMIVAWEAFQDNDASTRADGTSYGIYYQKLDPNGFPVLYAQANTVITTVAGTAYNASIHSDEFAGDQVNVSLAMDADGDYSIVWNGRGATPDALNPTSSPTTNYDPSGVWIRDFHTRASTGGSEAVTVQNRVNMTSSGYQGSATIAMDKEGNHVVVWSGNGVGDRQGIFSRLYPVATDTAGPMATELRDSSSNPIPGSEYNLQGNPASVVVVFDEELNTSALGSLEYVGSVYNVKNWMLTDKAGVEVAGAISSVDFALNPDTNKWEATVNFSGIQYPGGLADGNYILIARDTIQDKAGNVLGLSGYNAQGLTDTVFVPGATTDATLDLPDGYAFRFSVNQSQDNETDVDDGDGGGGGSDEETEISPDTGAGFEQSTQAVAISDSGSYVVVWTAIDTSGDRNIRMKLFSATGSVLASGIVNTTLAGDAINGTTTAGDRRLASVAMDADGDFIVVWEGRNFNSATNTWDWDIYARRYDAKGVATISDTDGNGLIEEGVDGTGEFVVNTATGGSQLNPTVAADNYGNFVVVWVSAGIGGNVIDAQLFDFRGLRRGAAFQVNEEINPSSTTSPDSVNINPAVDMNGTGAFVVVWDRVTEQLNGVDLDSVIVGRLFDRDGFVIVPGPLDVLPGTSTEIEVSVGGAGAITDPSHSISFGALGDSARRHSARNPSVSMTEDGVFTATWEAYEDNDDAIVSAADSYGIYYRRFDFTQGLAAAWTDDSQANVVITKVSDTETTAFDGDQVNPSVAMDDQGNYIIVWNGPGAVPNASDVRLTPTSIDPEGVWLRQFEVTTSSIDREYLGAQQRVNSTQAGEQGFASIATTPDGEAVVVWLSTAADGSTSVKVRHYSQSRSDAVGPQATELRLDSYSNTAMSDRSLVADGEDIQTDDPLRSLVVVFNEDMDHGSIAGERSVTNPNNWVLAYADGYVIQGGVSDVAFQHNSATNKWEATVTFSSELFPNGLKNGSYTLVVRGTVTDASGNNFLAQPLSLTQSLSLTGTPTTPTQTPQTYRPEGWTTTSTNDPTIQFSTYGFGFRFGVNSWAPTDPPLHSEDRYLLTAATTAAIDLMELDLEGNGTLMTSNLSTSVARNASGLTVVAWLQYVRTGPNDSVVSPVIYAQLFDSAGRALHDEPEMQFQPMEPNTQGNLLSTSDPVVAIDAQGRVLLVWAGTPVYPVDAGDDTDDTGIYGTWYDSSSGEWVGSTFRINQYTGGTQSSPAVACDDAGDFVVTWTSTNPGGSTNAAHPDAGGIYARFYNSTGAPVSDEVPVNTYTKGQQSFSSVAMDADGDVVAVWQSYEQKNLNSTNTSSDIFGQRFTKSGTRKGGEFQVNVYNNNAQKYADVAMDRNGDFVVAWQSVGQEGDSTSGIYARRYNSSGTALVSDTNRDGVIGGADTNAEFRVNVTTSVIRGGMTRYVNQEKPAVAMRRSSDGRDGDFVITWTANYQEELGEGSKGVFAGMFNADSTPFVLNGIARSEFRVNALVAGDQFGSDVAMDGKGDYVVGWLGPYTSPVGTTPDESGTGVYIRFLDPPSNHALVYTETASPILTVTGTSGVDDIVITAGATLGNWTVTVNGVAQSVPTTTTVINVDGLAGNDKITVNLSSGADAVDLSGTGGTIVGARGYSINLSNVENVTIDGKGGPDTAILRDTAGNDIFTAKSNEAEHESTGYDHVLKNFPTITAYGGKGTDTAHLYGSTGDDTFVAQYGLATMTSSLGYGYLASGFLNQYGYGVTGGTDTATLTGSDVVDSLTFTNSGGVWQARLTDWKQNIYAKSFATTSVDGRGGKDSAAISDSLGSDVLTASSSLVKMKTPDFTVSASAFESVVVNASSGYDTAELTDAAGNNNFVATPTRSILTGIGYSLRVNKFDNVTVSKVYGSLDTAYLSDSTGDDTFVSTPSYALLSGPNSSYMVRVKGFNSTVASATAGGTDVARLYGSVGADDLDATSQYVRLWGAKYSSMARVFKQVYVNGMGGVDYAKMTDAVLTQGNLDVSGVSSYTQPLWMSNFKRFTLKSSTGSPDQTVVAVDTVYTAHW